MNDAPEPTAAAAAANYTAYRNTPLTIPVLGAPPPGPQVAPGPALFSDPEGDRMTVRISKPPPLGTARVDTATGAVVFTPPYQNNKAPEGLTVRFAVQAADVPAGLLSKPVNVTVVIGAEGLGDAGAF